MSSDVLALVNFYAREGLYRHLQTVCSEVLKKRAGEPTLMFWRAYGMVMEGSVNEGIREYEQLLNRKEIALAVYAGLAHAHQNSRTVDREALRDMQSRMQAEERVAPEKALLQAATLLWHTKSFDKARDYANLAHQQAQGASAQALILRGWIDLTCGKQSYADRAMEYFDKALDASAPSSSPVGDAPAPRKKELEALLGKAKCLELKGQYAPALDVLTQVVVSYGWFQPALTEKAKILLAMNNWEEALETAQRVLANDGQNIEALRVAVTFVLVREARYSVAAARAADLLDAIDRLEPKNAILYTTVARPLARIAGRNAAVLQHTEAMLDRARKISPDSAEVLTEYATQLLMTGNLQEAAKAFRQASKVDETSTGALYGVIKCQILSGSLEDAAQQLEFLSEIQQSFGKSPDMALLSAMLAWRKERNAEQAGQHLKEALRMHTQSVKGVPMGHDFFVQYNPDFMVEIAREYLQHSGSEPLEAGEQAGPALRLAISCLEQVIQKVPGLLDAQLTLARARYIANDTDGAQRTLAVVLRLEPALADAHLLLAQILLNQDKFKQAGQALEQALAHDFGVRDVPPYHLIKARVAEAQGDLEGALKILEGAFGLPGVRTAGRGGPASASFKRAEKAGAAAGSGAAKAPQPVTLQDRASIYLALARVHTRLNHIHEATKVIGDAQHEFKGTTEETRVTIASCELALQRGEVEAALSMLRSVPAESPSYVKARTVMADVYLKHRSDQRAYKECYRELAERTPTLQNLVALAEAYLRVQEPERAIETYESALKRFPQEASLKSRIGKCLISTHDYARAIQYYRSAVDADPSKMELRYDLAELYTRLQKYDLAEQCIRDAIDQPKDDSDVEALILDVKCHLLLAQVHKGAGKQPAAVEALGKARSIQNSVLTRTGARGDNEAGRAQRQQAAAICHTLAVYHEEARDLDKAVAYYNEALKHDEADEKTMVALAKLQLARGELDGAQQQCSAMLRIDANHEEASMMLSEAMFRKNEFDAAIYHFQQLLDRKPSNYTALSKLLPLLRRAGRLPEALRLFKAAERASARAAADAGFHYCRGLYFRYMSNVHEALRELNLARKDGEWGERALTNMIELYINPDNETLFEEAVDGPAPAGKEASENVRAVERLLQEASKKYGGPGQVQQKPLKYMVLECYAMMATKNKQRVEDALNKYVDIFQYDKDHVGALLGMATAYMQLKQTPKARNHLKRIAKMNYGPEDGDDFERAWLMLAQIYVDGGKMDLAQELCKRALAANKSCAKAWEMLGTILEKEQAYKDAADHYENAWKLTSEQSCGIGFKLAFNYLKAKRFVEAIDICHKVLAIDPEYPKIRGEVLVKARMALRA
eukprot:tig00021623_g23008.t1